MRQSEQLLVAFQYQMRGLRKAHLVLFVTLENSEIDREHRDTETPLRGRKEEKTEKDQRNWADAGKYDANKLGKGCSTAIF